MPDFDHGVWNGLAGGDVDDLGVEDKVDTVLVFPDVLADILASDVVWSLGDFWGEDAGAVAGEEDGLLGGVGVGLA